MKVVKRDGREVEFDANKIKVAIRKANNEVDIIERVSEEKIDNIVQDIVNKDINNVEDIQDFIEKNLVELGLYKLSKKYIVYRYTRSLVREANTTDESILSLVKNSNKEVGEENSNKNSSVASTQRDLIAGEVSKDLTRRILLPKRISDAHNNGILHFHDSDYFIQNIFNCCLVDIKNMFEYGTVMNGKLIETPKSFQVACTVMTQIIAAVASGQYGGQSINISHLGKYLRYSRDKYYNRYKKEFSELNEEMINRLVEERIKEELRSGVQTIQYQINTLMTTNGQSPFVTLFLDIDSEKEYQDEVALIIEEILKQRYEGIKNEEGVYVTSAFPKLVYVLNEDNIFKGGKYDYLTDIAIKCSSKRMYPDYISSKIMKENYEGNVFSPMGCRSFLSPYKDENGEYKFEGRFNQGVVSLNLVQIALLSKTEEEYFKLLEDRLDLCFEALMMRHNRLKGTLSDISPIHWQYGAIARLKKGEKIDKYLMDGYSTISLGYIGIYEATKLITGETHTTEKGRKFAIKLMKKLEDTVNKWKKETGIGFGLYGTPAESLCYRFAKIDKEKFGSIKDITDKGYYTNSYHVDVREEINIFDKFKFESEFQKISSGGAISYGEIPNMSKNLDALKEIVKYIYDNIQYAEFNTKSDYCHICGFDEEIIINSENQWECPQCHNKDKLKMNVIRRTCGYLGENYWNEGKTREIGKRVLHL